MDFQHADVFAEAPFTGNSVTVFMTEGRPLPAGQMLAITQEFRHFESIFLAPGADGTRWRARVFDQIEELDFAGHPLLGAAAVLHDRLGGGPARQWTIELPAKTVTRRPPATRPGSAGRSTRAGRSSGGLPRAPRWPRSWTDSGSARPTWCRASTRPWSRPACATW